MTVNQEKQYLAGIDTSILDRVKADNENRKSIKISLPVRHHIRLHTGRVLRSEGISETVERALDAHFARLEAELAARRAAAAAGAPDQGLALG